MNDDGTFHMNFSTTDASQLLVQEDLKRWMRHHNRAVANKIGDEKQSKKYFEEVLQSLKLDKNPRKVASVLIGKDALVLDQPKIDLTGAALGEPRVKYDEIVAGRIAREKLRKQLQQQPHNSALSAGLLLTAARRKDILEKLKNGISVEDETIIPLDLVTNNPSEQEKKQNDSKGFKDVDDRRQSMKEESMKRAFKPKWEHYDTMRTRWTYIQPQTKHLVSSVDILAPVSSTCRFPVEDTSITGNLVEINNFLTRSHLSVSSIHDAMRSSKSSIK